MVKDIRTNRILPLLLTFPVRALGGQFRRVTPLRVRLTGDVINEVASGQHHHGITGLCPASSDQGSYTLFGDAVSRSHRASSLEPV